MATDYELELGAQAFVVGSDNHNPENCFGPNEMGMGYFFAKDIFNDIWWARE